MKISTDYCKIREDLNYCKLLKCYAIKTFIEKCGMETIIQLEDSSKIISETKVNDLIFYEMNKLFKSQMLASIKQNLEFDSFVREFLHNNSAVSDANTADFDIDNNDTNDYLLLLNKEEYNNISVKIEEISKYIFCYYESGVEIDKDYEPSIRTFAKDENLKIVICATGRSKKLFSESIKPSPQELISYIANASFIYTDSCAIEKMALIMEKPFKRITNNDTQKKGNSPQGPDKYWDRKNELIQLYRGRHNISVNQRNDINKIRKDIINKIAKEC